MMHRLGVAATVLGLMIGAHTEVRGAAIHTDGYGNYVEIADSPTVSPTAQMTLEAWVRRAPGQSGTVFNKYWGDSGPYHSRSFAFFVGPTGAIYTYISPEGATISARVTTAEGVVSAEVWTHVAVVYDGTDLIAYTNGFEVGRDSGPGGVHDGPLPIRMGCPDGPNGGAGDMQIDEARIWSVARTSDELRQGMFTPLTGAEPGLGGYWKFDDQDGRDYTANGNDGAIRGTVTWVEPGAPQPRSPALDMNAGGDYAEVPDSPTVSPTAQMTVEAWVWRAPGQGGIVLNKYWGDSGPYHSRSFSFGLGSNGELDAYISPEGASISAYLVTGGVVSAGVWTHVAVVYDGTDLVGYANGVEAGRLPGPGGIHDGPLPLTMGFRTSPYGGTGHIRLDEVRLWTVARTSDELRQGMFTPLTGAETGLGGYWKFDGQDVQDYTSNGNDGAVYGSVEWIEPGAPAEFAVGTVPVAVSLPDETATYEASISLPVQIGETTGLEVVSAELFVAYDGDLLVPAATPVTSTAMTTDWAVEYNIGEGNGAAIDTLKVAMADEVALSGSGDLVVLHFDVADVRHPAVSALELTHVLLNDGDPTVTATDGSVTLVGVDGTIESDPAEIIPRWDIDVTVTDVDEDRDGLSADSFEVAVTNGTQTETVTVEETGNSTGIFEGSIETVFSLSFSSDDGIVQALAGDAVEFCYGDSLDATGATVERCATTDVVGGHDSSIRTTVVSQPGDTVRVRVTDADLEASVDVVVANARTGEVESIVLSPFAIGDSHFYGRFFTDTQAGSVGDSTVEVAKGDVVVVTYGDTLTAVGGTAVRTDDDEVVDPFGDADGNGNVQAFDAAQVLFHRLQTYGGGAGSLSGLDSLSANVDSLGPWGIIDGYDASLVLRRVVGLVDRFEVQEPPATNHPQPETRTRPKRIPQERELALRVGDGYVSVWMEEREGIASGELQVEGIVGAVAMGEELGDFLMVSQEWERGMSVVFAGAEDVSGPGELLRVYPGVGPGGVRLTRASFNGGRIGARSVAATEGTVRPLAYALYGNAPNPFNPETSIGYALPVASVVELTVYDVVGQRVRVLVSGVHAPGMHEVVWDGRDDSGQQVGSGVYFYRLQARGSAGEWRSDASRPADLRFQQMRRMLLLK